MALHHGVEAHLHAIHVGMDCSQISVDPLHASDVLLELMQTLLPVLPVQTVLQEPFPPVLQRQQAVHAIPVLQTQTHQKQAHCA